MKEKLLISSCLYGLNTKYSGGNNKISKIKELEEKYKLILACPEVLGGLSTPRDPSEQMKDKVFSNKGLDVTDNFNLGASKTLEIIKKHKIKKALLKESSPSCGSNLIYDGTFSGTKINGLGVTAKLLKENGITIYNENEIDLLLEV